MPSKICLFVQRTGLVCFFWGSNGSMISHSLSFRLLEYGTGWSTTLPPNLSFSPEIPNRFYKRQMPTKRQQPQAIESKISSVPPRASIGTQPPIDVELPLPDLE